VNPPAQTSLGNSRPREPVLERAAMTGNIDLFELLRRKGAPLDRTFGVFPKAVMVANDAPSSQMIRMLADLLDVVGCDVNSNSQGAYYGSGSGCSTPLCWIACYPRDKNTKRLIWFLLDHGGDPDLCFTYTDPNDEVVVVQSARQAAKERSNLVFLEAVSEWETRHHGDAAEGT
jgi:hypothetical protein